MAAGSFCLLLGTVGIFIPLLPTVPLLILAAICYGRSSERCYLWLVGNRVFGRHLDDYLHGRGVSWKAKAGTLVLLWGVIAPTALLLISPLWVQVLLFLVAAGVSAHVVSLRSRIGRHVQTDSKRQ